MSERRLQRIEQIHIQGATFNITVDIILDDENERYISIPALCDALDLEVSSQRRRTNRNFAMYSRLLPLDTSSGKQDVSCLQVRSIDEWLQGLRQGKMTDEQREKLAVFQRDLAVFAKSTFPHVPVVIEPNFADSTARSLFGTEETDLPLELTDLNEIEDGRKQNDSAVFHLPKQEEILAQVANRQPGSHLIVTSTAGDTAFRESCLDADGWIYSESMPYYRSSDQIIVYLENPTRTVDLETAESRIRSFGETTVMTARIALGFWILERENPARLQSNGTIAIRPEDILIWRGIAQHTRAAYSGSEARISDGYESKYFEQVHRDFLYIQDCYMYSEQGQPIKFEGPYAHVTAIRGQRTLWGPSDEVLFYLFAPGGWIVSATGKAYSHFGIALKRVFELRPNRQKYALRIALYLIERWAQLSSKGDFEEAICMRDLLRSSIIDPDRIDFPVLRNSVIHALTEILPKQKIVGKVQQYIPPALLTRSQKEQFLASYWSLPPHSDILQQYGDLLQVRPRSQRSLQI